MISLRTRVKPRLISLIIAVLAILISYRPIVAVANTATNGVWDFVFQHLDQTETVVFGTTVTVLAIVVMEVTYFLSMRAFKHGRWLSVRQPTLSAPVNTKRIVTRRSAPQPVTPSLRRKQERLDTT